MSNFKLSAITIQASLGVALILTFILRGQSLESNLAILTAEIVFFTGVTIVGLCCLWGIKEMHQ